MEFLAAVGIIYAGMGVFTTLVACALLGGLCIAMAFEKIEAIATLSVVAVIALLVYGPTRDLLWAGAANWDTVLGYLAAYLLFGGLWSIFKFWRYMAYLKRRFDAYLEKKGKTVKDISTMSGSDRREFMSQLESHMTHGTKYGEVYPTRPSCIKGTITTWITYWPVSMLTYLFEEPIKRAVDFMYNTFTGIYTRISKIYSADFEQLKSGN